jgi:DNA-binding winged helix-turn-helix (wHTH) protein/TolB-like protein
VVRFGQFEFDPATGVLTRDGSPVRLPRQPARVLAQLVGRPGAVVGRDELRAAIWGDQTFVDFERGLNFCIAQIRSALRDSADAPRYIETLPKRGYRFIAPITPTPQAAPAQVSAPTIAPPAPTPQSSRHSSRVVGVVGVLLAALTLTGALLARHYASPSAAVRVAVVPFDNETGLTEFDRIAGGIADATVARLATPDRLGRVAVVGNSAALRRPRAFRDLKALGEELRVEFVVLAQVKSDEGRARLIAHLIRVDDQAHVWANTFDRPAFTLDAQAEVAESIADAVVSRVRDR